MSTEKARELTRAGEVVEDYIVRTVLRRRKQLDLQIKKKQHSLRIEDRAKVEMSQGGWENAVTFFQACVGTNGLDD